MHPWVRSGGLPAAVDVAVSAQTALPPLPPPRRPSPLASGRADWQAGVRPPPPGVLFPRTHGSPRIAHAAALATQCGAAGGPSSAS